MGPNHWPNRWLIGGEKIQWGPNGFADFSVLSRPGDFGQVGCAAWKKSLLTQPTRTFPSGNRVTTIRAITSIILPLGRRCQRHRLLRRTRRQLRRRPHHGQRLRNHSSMKSSIKSHLLRPSEPPLQRVRIPRSPPGTVQGRSL